MNCCPELAHNVYVFCEDGEVANFFTKNSSFNFMSRGHASRSEALDFGDKNYRQLVTKRPLHILSFITRGINVLYTDIDTVFLKNPFTWFNRFSEEILASVDMKSWKKWTPYYCTGILSVRSSAHTINFLQNWHNLTLKSEYRHFMNQPLFNMAVRKNRASIRSLDRDHFPPGSVLKSSKEFIPDKAIIVHANFVKGLRSKIELLKSSGNWLIA